MKVLLRDTATGLFYVDQDSWSSDPAIAQDFKRPDRALDHVTESNLQRVELVMGFDGMINMPMKIVSTGR
jgi:hypothetical protein